MDEDLLKEEETKPSSSRVKPVRISIFLYSDDEKDRGAIEVLNQVHRKKSDLIVKALGYYLARNPQVLDGYNKKRSIDLGGIMLEEDVPLIEDPAVKPWITGIQNELLAKLEVTNMMPAVREVVVERIVESAPKMESTAPTKAPVTPVPAPKPAEVVALEDSPMDADTASSLLDALDMFGF